MFRYLQLITVFISLSFVPAFAGDPLGQDRGQMKEILKQVSAEIEKRYWDPELKGVNWKVAVEEAQRKIDTAETVNDMLAAIYELPRKLDDSHTNFIPPMSSVRAVYGFELKAFGNAVYVYDVDAKEAAARAGLRSGDQINAINDIVVGRESLERTLFYQRALYPLDPMVLDVLRGTEHISILIHPKIKQRPHNLDRFSRYGDVWSQRIEMQNYAEKYLKFKTGMIGEVGYLNIREFPYEGASFLSGLAGTIKGSSALIIDLRETPGGTVETLLRFLGMFEDTEVQLGAVIGREKTQALTIRPMKPTLRGALFLLVDSETASAAEVAVRYLQKSHRAVVVGDKTAGMVTMARIFAGRVGTPFVVDFATQIAVARLTLNDGEELEKRGVTPDVICLPSAEDLANQKDPCLGRAVALAESAMRQSASSPQRRVF